jgi:hypothetical protein
VALIELHEGLVSSPLQSVVEVITPSHSEPSRHGWVSGESRDVYLDLTAPKPTLMVRMTMADGAPHVAKTVQHISKQGGKPGAVQPVTTEPSISSEGGVGVVIHLSKTRE